MICEDDLMLDFSKAIVDMNHATINAIVQKLKAKAEINLIERANELLECVDPEEYETECKQERAISDYENRGCSDFEV